MRLCDLISVFIRPLPWQRDLLCTRSRCHGNVRLNDDSKSQRSIPIASRVIIYPVDVRGGQSARDDKSHTCTWRAECA